MKNDDQEMNKKPPMGKDGKPTPAASGMKPLMGKDGKPAAPINGMKPPKSKA